MSKNYFHKTEFYNNQNKSTQAYLEKTPIWHDSDMITAFLLGNAVGIVFGFILAFVV